MGGGGGGGGGGGREGKLQDNLAFRLGEGRMLVTSALKTLRWPIYIINSVGKNQYV